MCVGSRRSQARQSLRSTAISSWTCCAVSLSQPSVLLKLLIIRQELRLTMLLDMGWACIWIGLNWLSCRITYCHCQSLLVYSTLNSNRNDTFSLNPSRHRPFHRPAFTDTGLLNGFLFSFVSINLLVWFVQ